MKTFLFLLLAPVINAAKLLLIPTDHVPEIRAFAQLGQHLKGKGHDPVILIPARHRSVIKDSGLEIVAVKETPTYFVIEDMKRLNEIAQESGWRKMQAVLQAAHEESEEIYTHCKDVLTDVDLIKRLQDDKFDIAIVNAIELSQCLFLIPYKLDIPYISITWEISSWVVQLPEMPSISGQFGMNQFAAAPNFMDRLMSLVLHVVIYNSYPNLYHKDHHIAELVPEKPRTSYQELVRGSEIILITRDNFCMDYPRLESPHVHYVGGATSSHIQLLPERYEEFANGAKEGLVVVCFGSLNNPWPDLMQRLMDAFSRLPQRFVMRYVGEFDGVPQNVMISPWIPQNDLLRHNNTVLYFGHGGQNGQSEAHYHGVPMVIIPFMWDQEYAAERVELKKYGKSLDRFSSSDRIYSTIMEVISNTVYRENVARCSRILKRLPTSHDSIEWWINHVTTFGGGHLKPQFADMSAFNFYMLDVLVFLLVLGVGVVFVFVKGCICCKRMVCNNKVKKE